MKLASLFLTIPVLFSFIDPSSTASSATFASSEYFLSKLELEELAAKDGKDLEAWLNEKRLEHDIISEESSLRSSGKSSSISRNISSKLSNTNSSTAIITIVKFDRKLLIALGDALHFKDHVLASKIIDSIPNWKMAFQGSNFSVLSLIVSKSKKRYLGKLFRPDALEYFKYLIGGQLKFFSGGYFLALSLFHPMIQTQVISLLIENAPNLRGLILINSIYYNLHESVFNLLIDCGAAINFAESVNVSTLKSFPDFDQSTNDQVSVSKNLFMNFFEKSSSFSYWERKISLDPEVNFLYGMVEVDLPNEIGVLRVAFEDYSSEVVMKLVELSPMPALTKYHLAHLLAKSPEKRSGYPAIESLVDSNLVLNRMRAGESDLVALAFLSVESTADQVQIITEFLSKTTIFTYPGVSNDRTFIYQPSKDIIDQSGIPEFPLSPAHVFFLTACKCNIADDAFALVWNVCKNIRSKNFAIAKRNASDWAISKRLNRKIEIMSQH